VVAEISASHDPFGIVPTGAPQSGVSTRNLPILAATHRAMPSGLMLPKSNPGTDCPSLDVPGKIL
jgi:hypothetical protein